MAFVVRQPGEAGDGLDEDAVMDFVAAKVAPFKKIRRVEFIDAVPKSSSGKILRRMLKPAEPAAAGSPAARGFLVGAVGLGDVDVAGGVVGHAVRNAPQHAADAAHAAVSHHDHPGAERSASLIRASAGLPRAAE